MSVPAVQLSGGEVHDLDTPDHVTPGRGVADRHTDPGGTADESSGERSAEESQGGHLTGVTEVGEEGATFMEL